MRNTLSPHTVPLKHTQTAEQPHHQFRLTI